jgi:hypothetical protein
MTNNVQNENKQPAADGNAKVHEKIKQAWSKLSEDDVKLYDTNRMQFFNRLKEKQDVSKEDAEKKIKEFEVACGCSSTKAA